VPQEGRKAQNSGNEESLQRAFPADPASQQEIKPDQPCIMGLDSETSRQTQNADQPEPLLKKAPDSHYAKAYNDASRVTAAKDHLAVCKQDANKEKRDFWRISCAKTPHKEGGKSQNSGGERQP
jgi:hypothetical protein